MNASIQPTRLVRARILAATFAAAAVACSAPSLLRAQTQGELFKNFHDEQHAICKASMEGPYAPPESRGDKRRGMFSTNCDILLLDTPEDPTKTEAGRQAHAIRLPAPHDKPKDVYKPGMSSAEYFQALCAAEAGEFIFRTVDNVEGVFEMRPRTKAPNYAFNHLYYLEDPYGYSDSEVSSGPFQLIVPNRYKFAERFDGSEIVRLTGARWAGVDSRQTTPVDKRATRYGYTWRGIKRTKDREHGIAGGELIVVDLETQEVLGVRRGFAYTGVGSRGSNWEFGPVCPKYGYQGGRNKDVGFTFWFVGKVLLYPGQDIEFKKLRGEIPWN